MVYLVEVGALLMVVVLAWVLAQQNALAKEPLARLIGLSYGAIAVSAVGWVFASALPFGGLMQPAFLVCLVVHLLLVAWRLHVLYEKGGC